MNSGVPPEFGFRNSLLVSRWVGLGACQTGVIFRREATLSQVTKVENSFHGSET